MTQETWEFLRNILETGGRTQLEWRAKYRLEKLGMIHVVDGRWTLTARGKEDVLDEAQRRENLKAKRENRDPRRFASVDEVALRNPSRMDFDDIEPINL